MIQRFWTDLAGISDPLDCSNPGASLVGAVGLADHLADLSIAVCSERNYVFSGEKELGSQQPGPQDAR